MENTPELTRTYYFSDTYGGPMNPFTQPDADANICTDFRSRPLEKIHREFDTYGQSKTTDHLLRLVLELHDQAERGSHLPDAFREKFRRTITGIFVNTAARTEKGANGEPFYLATARNGRVRIVATPLGILTPIRTEVEELACLPNTGNGLYKDQEQFRSSYTPLLLDPSHGHRLIPQDIGDIPPESDPEKWEVAYIDRFGNIVTHASKNPLTHIAAGIGEVRVAIGEIDHLAALSTSLGEAAPGKVALYQNGNIDLVRKWEAGETHQERLRRSAYVLFGEPAIGEKVRIVPDAGISQASQ